MRKKGYLDISVGDRFYIIDDFGELFDILEFYPSGRIDPVSIVGKLAVILEKPQLQSNSWDGCILLSFDNGITSCKLPMAALDMNRSAVEEGHNQINDNYLPISSPLNHSNDVTAKQRAFLAGSIQSIPFFPPSTAVSGLFSSSITTESDIIYVRDSSSESTMIQQLAAESIQDAFR
jgi:hypothetical protein